MGNVLEIIDELNEINDDIDLNYDKQDIITKDEIDFAEDIQKFLQEIINNEQKGLNEEFTSESSLNQHFSWHCLAGDINKKSKRTNIYYDFRNVNEYKKLEDDLSNKIKAGMGNVSITTVSDLQDTELLLKGFHKLFEGNQVLFFPYTCGFKNDTGDILLSFISYANNTTQNYTKSNTIHCLIMSRKFRTITLYPVDASYVENKFNNLVDKYAQIKIVQVKINR